MPDEKTLGGMTAEIRSVNIDKGWRAPEGGPGANTFGDYLALLHSEVSEALEAYRDHRLADATERPVCIGDIGCPGWHKPTPLSGEYDHGNRAPCPVGHMHLPNPEGVGSELADVLIRLLDMADVFSVKPYDMDMELRDVAPLVDAGNMQSFGDHLALLHYLIGALTTTAYGAGWTEFLRALVMVSERYDIDLAAEYERKIAYNRTRPHQHGGRTVADGVGSHA